MNSKKLVPVLAILLFIVLSFAPAILANEEEAAFHIPEDLKNKTNELRDKGHDLKEKAEDKAHDLKDKGADKADDLKDKASDAAHDAAQKITPPANDLKNKIKDVTGNGVPGETMPTIAFVSGMLYSVLLLLG